MVHLVRTLTIAAGLLAMTAGSAVAVEGSIFPLPGGARAGTPFVDGQFGAFRAGRKANRGCGRGHCGVDLHAPDGTPVLAIRRGRVDQVERSADGRGGRWVRLLHEDGTSTWYMHLADVRDDLVRGQDIVAGETLGTLGRTGVHSSPTHLHFAVSVGPPRREQYLDPTRLLERAELVSEPVSGPIAVPVPPALAAEVHGPVR